MSKSLYICSGCGAQVMKYQSQLTNIKAVFCNLACRNRNYQSVISEWKPSNYLGPVNKICKSCQEPFKVSRRDGGSNRLFCSKTCSGKLNSIGKTHSAKTKAKLSAIAAKQAPIRFCTHSSGQRMRSSWEVKYADYLDSKNIGWLYEPSFVLSNGTTYLPDFMLDDGSIVEIKGYFRQDAMLKWERFCKDYEFIEKKILFKEDMKNLGLI